MSKKEFLLVAAVDFGTTFSGYAFSFRHEYEENRMNIYANTSWIASGPGLVSWKTPTTLLLNPDKSFNSFGYQAEEEYIDLMDNGRHMDYFYFKRFKMYLHDKVVLDRNVKVVDISGKEMYAREVFAMSIGFLKGHLMETLRKRNVGIVESDVQFVLTIPAIWNEPAKQFMREAAVEAGITSGNLMLALEPEAASLYCKNLPLDKIDTGIPGQTRIVPFENGVTYMVLDLGGGTVDVTVHEVTGEETLKEIYKASGGAWGGIKVDEAFHNILKGIVSGGIYEQFCKEHRPDLLDVEREFELRKRSVQATTQTERRPISMQLPVSLLTTYEDTTHRDRNDALLESGFSEKIHFKRGKMQFEADLFHSMFHDCISSIINHVHDILNRPEVKRVDAILMVGGFSEANIIVEALREEFESIRVIVPQDAGLAVVKGAVLYGHNPTAISSRICKFSYGVAARCHFREGIHPEHLKQETNGKSYCINVFDKFVDIGDSIDIGYSVDRVYGITDINAPITIQIYASSETCPQFTSDESCFRIGNIFVHPPTEGWQRNTRMNVSMWFGGTEFKVTANDETNKDIQFEASFDFLSCGSTSV